MRDEKGKIECTNKTKADEYVNEENSVDQHSRKVASPH
jgi:hypothetical protein